MKETGTQPIMEFTENYKSNWKSHVLRIPRSRIPFWILRYRPKGLRTYKRGHDITDMLLLLLMMMMMTLNCLNDFYYLTTFT